MGESLIHKQFIKKIYNCTLNIIPAEHSKLIVMDSDENLIVKEVPPIINGYRPDLYYEFNSILVIGEAKTKNDFDTKHSLNQYKEYIRYCVDFQGKSFLVLGCPWTCIPDLKLIVNKLKKSYKKEIDIIFLDEISGD